MLKYLVLVLLCAIAACGDRDSPREALLTEGKHDPVLHTEVIHPDLFVVKSVRTYGQGEALVLVVGEDSDGSRRAFSAPASQGLKRDDVIRVHKLCYRFRETYGNGRLHESENACTYVVIKHRPGTAPPKAEQEAK